MVAHFFFFELSGNLVWLRTFFPLLSVCPGLFSLPAWVSRTSAASVDLFSPQFKARRPVGNIFKVPTLTAPLTVERNTPAGPCNTDLKLRCRLGGGRVVDSDPWRQFFSMNFVVRFLIVLNPM